MKNFPVALLTSSSKTTTDFNLYFNFCSETFALKLLAKKL